MLDFNVNQPVLQVKADPSLSEDFKLTFLTGNCQLGQFVIPDLLGGARTVLLGNILQQQFGTSRDWPFGSAIAVFSMLFIAGAVLLYSRENTQEEFL